MAKHLTDFRQGDTKPIKINYGAGVDITGYVHMFTIRKDFADGTVITAQAISTAGNHTLDDVLNGLAHVELDSTVSSGIPPDCYIYDVQRVRPNGLLPVHVLTLIPPVEDFDDLLLIAPQATKVTS